MFTRNQTEILRILTSDADREYSLSQLGRAIGKAPGVFQRGLNGLENLDYITSRRSGNRRLIKLNTSHGHAVEIAGIVGKPASIMGGDFYIQFPPEPVAAKTMVAEPSGVYETARHRILILAGPNGAGKTTFAKQFLVNEASCPAFINADYIAHGLSPFSPEDAAFSAGRLMIDELDNHIMLQHNVAIETTLSGRRYINMIPRWQEAGYRVKLIFLSLVSVDLAIERVAGRTLQGGHNIPEPTIRRRYDMGKRNFEEIYKPLVDAWVLYDNSGPAPVLIEEWEQQQ